MELEINQIDFTIAINTFHDDSSAKIQYLTKLELDFLRKFQSRVNFTQYHSQMIFQIRKIVNIIQEVFKDVQDYFYDLKIGFAYELIRKIQTLMVIGYNHLSQALLITFDIYERQKNKQVRVSECTCNGKKQKNDAVLNKDQRKKLEHIDYTISSLQSEQQRLTLEMQTMYDRMLLQKNLIDKIKPSLAIRELQQMKDHLQTVMQENQKIFQQNFMMQFFELHNQIKKIDKPEEINELYKKINSNLKDNFVKHIVKTAGKINQQRKKINNSKNCVQVQTMDLILSKTKSKKQSSSPSSVNNSILKASSFNINAKQRKAVMQKSGIELNQLKKTIQSLNQELQLLKQQNKKQTLKFNTLESNYNTIQSIYQQVRGQLQIMKSQSNWKTEKLTAQNKLLKNQLSRLNFYRPKQESFAQTDIFQFLQTQQTQTHQQYSIPDKQNQIIKLLKTRNEKAIIMINQKDKKIRQINNQNFNSINQLKILKEAVHGFVNQIKSQFQLNLIEAQSISNATAAIIAKTLQQTLFKLKQCKHKFQSKNRAIKKNQFKRQSKTSLISQTQIHQINQNDQYKQENLSNQLLKTQQSQKSLFDTVSEYISMQDRKKRRISAINILNLNKPKTFNKIFVENNQKQTQTQLIWNKNQKFQQFSIDESVQKKQYSINKKSNLLNNDESQEVAEQSFRLKQEHINIKAKTHRKYLSNINNDDISQIQNSAENSSLYLHSIRKSSSKFKKINISNRSSQKINKNKNIKTQNEKELIRISKLRISSGFQMMKKKQIPLNDNEFCNQTHRRMNSTAGKVCFQNLKMDFNKNQNSNNQIRNNISKRNKTGILTSDIEQKKQSLNIFALAKEQSKLLNVNVNDQKQYAGSPFTPRQGFQKFEKFKQSTRDNKMANQNFDKQNFIRPNVTQNVKKRSLLLSVQKYKENTQSLLVKELTRMMERFGKEKTKECYQKILTKQKSHIDNFNTNFMGTI